MVEGEKLTVIALVGVWMFEISSLPQPLLRSHPLRQLRLRMLLALGVDVGGYPFGEALAEEAAGGFVGVAAGLFGDDGTVVEREHFRRVIGDAEDEEA